MPRNCSLFAPLAALALAVSFSSRASATDRHFTYTYESNVLNPGGAELEPWTTFRGGRDDYYSRFDQRLELEVGVVPDLQTAVYWNMTAVAADQTDAATGQSTRVSSYEFGGISNEWKYKLSDSFADSLGSALYFEWTAAPTEVALEAKVILDKRMGDALVAFNVEGEHEWSFAGNGESGREVEIAASLAFGYFVSPSVVLGVEARSHTELEGGKEHEVTAFFAGPSIAYAQKAWWTALTVQPQVFAIKSETGEAGTEAANEGSLDLMEHERIEVRLLLGLEL